MSNKQEFPIPSKRDNIISSPPSKSGKIYTNHPYFDYKPILQNDYTHDRNFPLKPGPIQTTKILSPLILSSPTYLNNFNQNFTQTKDFQVEEKFSQANIHDSFKFSEFQNDYHSEDYLSQKALSSNSLEVYNSYDLNRSKSKFRSNRNKDFSKEQIKFMAMAFQTQISFIRTLDQVKQRIFDFFSRDTDRIYEIFFKDLANGSLNFYDFMNIFKILNIEADAEDVKLLFWRYGVERIGLDINAFKRYFIPIYKKPYEIEENSNGDEKELIVKVLKMNLNFEYSLEVLRKEIKRKNIGLKNIFEQISLKEALITTVNMKNFLKEFRIKVEDEDIEALYSLYDPKKEGLTFKMFYQELLPKI